MKEALDYAIQIIEGYELEIRSLLLPPGATQTGGNQQRIEIIPGDNNVRTLADVGFCQGAIYKTAIESINKLKENTSTLDTGYMIDRDDAPHE